MPPRLRWYLLGLVAATVGLWVAFRLGGVGDQRAFLPVVAGLLCVLSVAAYQFQVLIGPDCKAHVANSPLLVGAFVFGAADAMELAFVAAFAGNLLLRAPGLPRPPQHRPLWNCLFNAAQMALSIGAAAGVYHAVDRRSPTLDPDALPVVAAVVVAAGLAYAVNTFAVAVGVTYLQGSGNPFERWLDDRRRDWRQEAGLALLAFVTALLVTEYPWAVVIQAGSIVIVHLSFAHTAQLLRQTRSTLERLARVVDARDPYTARHSANVARYAETLARRAGLPAAEVELIRLTGLVHDVGKIAVRDAVLLKPGRLTEEEYGEMKRHAEAGAEMVGDLEEYRAGRSLILHHHEAWDGTGYPTGLSGEGIPLGARILAVADSYDAMTTDRPYRKALPAEVVVEQLRRGRGTQWDPHLVDLWLREMGVAAEPAPESDPASSAALNLRSA